MSLTIKFIGGNHTSNGLWCQALKTSLALHLKISWAVIDISGLPDIRESEKRVSSMHANSKIEIFFILKGLLGIKHENTTPK